MHTCNVFCHIYFLFSPLPRSSPSSSSQILNLVSDGLPNQTLVCKSACLSTKLKLCFAQNSPGTHRAIPCLLPVAQLGILSFTLTVPIMDLLDHLPVTLIPNCLLLLPFRLGFSSFFQLRVQAPKRQRLASFCPPQLQSSQHGAVRAVLSQFLRQCAEMLYWVFVCSSELLHMARQWDAHL